MKRVRYLELAKIADEICNLLQVKKIKHSEGCVIRHIAEGQWNAMRKGMYEDLQGDQAQIPMYEDRLTDNV